MAVLRKDRGTSIAPRTRDDAAGMAPRDPNAWFSEMDRWFDEMRNDFGRAWGVWPGLLPRVAAAPAVRVPALDVRDDGTEFVVTAELPGVSKEDLRIRTAEDGLEITAEVQRAREEKDEDHFFRERTYSAFERTVPLPAKVVTDKVVANLKDGVLEVRLPKQEPAPVAKPVKVKVG